MYMYSVTSKYMYMYITNYIPKGPNILSWSASGRGFLFQLSPHLLKYKHMEQFCK